MEQVGCIELRKTLKEEKFAENQSKIDSNLWKKLPTYVLCDHVFSQLPINEVCNLRCLSKTWKHKISTSPSFISHCDKASPILLSLVTQGGDGNIWVRMLNAKSNKWYTYKLEVDGHLVENRGGIGLICYSTREVDCKPKICLVNPLTRYLYQLPVIPNKWTLNYVKKLGNCVVVSVEEEERHWNSTITKVYYYDVLDKNGKWTLTQPKDQNLSLQLDSLGTMDSSYLTTIENLKKSTLSKKKDLKIMDSVYHEQSFYVLWKKSNVSILDISLRKTKYYIIEYHKNEETLYKEVVENKVHNVYPLEWWQFIDEKTTNAKLYACEGYLMIVVSIRCHNYREDLAWLYDLATCEWTSLDFPGLHFDYGDIGGYLLKSKWKLDHNLRCTK